ncbi:MAG: carbohydrate ABC transporter permease [Chloroflexi bacterium]|nr:carbohydrate ABC transporter permease [Chloroflexota bacterium]
MTVQTMGRAASATPTAPRWPASYLAGRVLLHAFAVLLAVIFTAPFFFAISTSLKTPVELHTFPPSIFPADPQPFNYARVFQVAPYGVFYLNTVIIAVTATIGNVICASIAAYGFARFRWRGREICFMVLLSTLVIPEEVVIIPKFLMFHIVPEFLFGTSWINTWWPLILPSWIGGGAFNVFLLRQFLMQLPRDLDEAAKIDGAGPFRILWSILLPLTQPAIATVAIFSFLNHWRDFIHPLIYLNSREKFPLSLGLRWFQQLPLEASEPREHLLMAAALLMALPCILLFFTMQRYFVRGIVMSGIKG